MFLPLGEDRGPFCNICSQTDLPWKPEGLSRFLVHLPYLRLLLAACADTGHSLTFGYMIGSTMSRSFSELGDGLGALLSVVAILAQFWEVREGLNPWFYTIANSLSEPQYGKSQRFLENGSVECMSPVACRQTRLGPPISLPSLQDHSHGQNSIDGSINQPMVPSNGGFDGETSGLPGRFLRPYILPSRDSIFHQRRS